LLLTKRGLFATKVRGLLIFFEGVLEVDHTLLADLDEPSLRMIEVGDDRDDEREQDRQDHHRKRVPAGLTERGRITRSPADGDRHQHQQQQPNGTRHVVTQSGLPLCIEIDEIVQGGGEKWEFSALIWSTVARHIVA
jgi:hypothetical protein